VSDNQIKITITMPDIFWRAIGATTKTLTPPVPLRAPDQIESKPLRTSRRRKNHRRGISNVRPELLKRPHAKALYSEGLTTSEIAAASGYAATTVKNQLEGAYELTEEVRQAIVARCGEDGFARIMRLIEEYQNV
jgi:hypothetical protein